jgi:hypothetical protein
MTHAAEEGNDGAGNEVIVFGKEDIGGSFL